MKTHPLRGEEILANIRDFDGCLSGVKHHHEHYDGSGYPDGLKGENIPIIPGIIAVADAFDAIISDRPYRKGIPKESAIQEICAFSGVWFNPKVAQAIAVLYEQGEI